MKMKNKSRGEQSTAHVTIAPKGKPKQIVLPGDNKKLPEPVGPYFKWRRH